MNIIGSNIKSIRVSSKLNQKELGNIMGVTKNYICQIENGAKSPSQAFVKLFCEHFDVSKDVLYKEPEVIEDLKAIIEKNNLPQVISSLKLIIEELENEAASS